MMTSLAGWHSANGPCSRLGEMDDQPNKHTVPVDQTTSELVFALKWHGPSGGGSHLALSDPKGPITPGTPGVSYRLGGTDEVYRVRSVHSGEWTANVHGSQNTPYVLLVSGHTAVEFTLYTSADLTPARQGAPLQLLGLLTSEGRPIVGADFVARVEGPHGVSNELRLYDDGQHSDGAPSDGFYANTFWRTAYADEIDRQMDPGIDRGLLVRGSLNIHAKHPRRANSRAGMIRASPSRPAPTETETGCQTSGSCTVA